MEAGFGLSFCLAILMHLNFSRSFGSDFELFVPASREHNCRFLALGSSHIDLCLDWVSFRIKKTNEFLHMVLQYPVLIA